jgi:hypothetical protein
MAQDLTGVRDGGGGGAESWTGARKTAGASHCTVLQQTREQARAPARWPRSLAQCDGQHIASSFPVPFIIVIASSWARPGPASGAPLFGFFRVGDVFACVRPVWASLGLINILLFNPGLLQSGSLFNPDPGQSCGFRIRAGPKIINFKRRQCNSTPKGALLAGGAPGGLGGAGGGGARRRVR